MTPEEITERDAIIERGKQREAVEQKYQDAVVKHLEYRIEEHRREIGTLQRLKEQAAMSPSGAHAALEFARSTGRVVLRIDDDDDDDGQRH